MINKIFLNKKALKIISYNIFFILVSSNFSFANQERPNILWIVSEDNSPILGIYGDKNASTPHLDKLGERSLVFDKAFANSPVCAPTRFSILTGMHANALGTGNMRSRYKIPSFVKPYTYYMKQAGYHVSNNNKTDYNFLTLNNSPSTSLSYMQWQNIDNKFWDSENYKDRKDGQPFFHIYNLYESHESRLHSDFEHRKLDPKKVILPPYHPDTNEIRNDWALYYDRVTHMDSLVGKKLNEFKKAGLLDSTIIFYYSDHGGALPRSKRFLYDTGTRIPLMIHIPKKYEYLLKNLKNTRTDQIVDIVDFAPTLLYLAGIEKPRHMHGKNIFSDDYEKFKNYTYLYRGRMDVRIDLSRAIRNKRFKYIRNFMPHRPHGQHLAYMWKAASTRSWESVCKNNKCNAVQNRFWEEKSHEELYDTLNDPWEIKNLALDPQYKNILDSMRKDLKDKNRLYKDIGFIPEGELIERTKNMTAYDLVQQEDFPINLIIETAEIASNRSKHNFHILKQRLSHSEPVVRYWAAVGCAILKNKSYTAKKELQKLLSDSSADVQIAAAEALLYNSVEDRPLEVLMKNLNNENPMIKIHAANVIDSIGDKASPIAHRLKKKVNELKTLELQGKLSEENYLLTALSHTVSNL